MQNCVCALTTAPRPQFEFHLVTTSVITNIVSTGESTASNQNLKTMPAAAPQCNNNNNTLFTVKKIEPTQRAYSECLSSEKPAAGFMKGGILGVCGTTQRMPYFLGTGSAGARSVGKALSAWRGPWGWRKPGHLRPGLRLFGPLVFFGLGVPRINGKRYF